MYASIDEEADRRSVRELRIEAERLTAERAALSERLRDTDARVALLRAHTTELAQGLCVMLKTVRRELKRKDAQRAELEAATCAWPASTRAPARAMPPACTALSDAAAERLGGAGAQHLGPAGVMGAPCAPRL